jgi:hypothetical protein
LAFLRPNRAIGHLWHNLGVLVRIPGVYYLAKRA